ncbi:MAG: hypothetical protein AVDCRST_MAG34-1561 [uncultured Nocardioidaceae bacterium]|uniref:DUF4267 domain-containing protein n=1 Tax=uncultured Nocardioidaceae bacterium TaxID=253824 RepID=A0A6J4L5I0_9ACTN|nr:MAG: hypothetical protein AVDCRST_MAG34-1561 [uncultured Nocardioidaceae bacterium]
MDNATSLSLARIAVGAAAYAVPERSLKAMMLDHTHHEAPFLMRIFGIRDLALGVATLLARPEHKPALVRLGMLVDAGDAGAGALALRAHAVKPALGAVLTGVPASAVVAGLVALGQQKRKRKKV